MKKWHPVSVMVAFVGVATMMVFGAWSVVDASPDGFLGWHRRKAAPSFVPPQWQYKVVEVQPWVWRPEGKLEASDASTFYLHDEDLNTNGMQGWELVSVVNEIETKQTIEYARSILGGGRDVAGPNVRNAKLRMFYKRQLPPPVQQ